MKTIAAIWVFLFSLTLEAQTLRVGAKHFNEGYLLSEMLAQLLEDQGFKVERKFNLGGTVVCFEALRKGEIDVYPEYTGSLAEEILKSSQRMDIAALGARLREDLGLEISPAFGFNNTYALAVGLPTAKEQNLKSISDLTTYPQVKAAMSYEFLKRQDGWHNLKLAYGLAIDPVGIEHGLAYQAVASGKIELTDVYSTDGEIKKYNLVILEDDLHFFPDYQAVAVYNKNLDIEARQAIAKLEAMISEGEMQAMNAQVLYEGKNFAEVAYSFLQRKHLISQNAQVRKSRLWGDLLEKTLAHLGITALALALAIGLALPLGILLYIFPRFSRAILYFTGLLQTIPSIALLALMIPIFGIGKIPAIIALFLYALLPILRSTVTGLTAVDPILKTVAEGMGMSRWQKLRYVEMPLAMLSVLAGIRMAAVITIGTATLAAFIGAGGLGEFIVTGLALNNTEMIMQGAIPAALLAIVVEFFFELLEKALIPPHLRSK